MKKFIRNITLTAGIVAMLALGGAVYAAPSGNPLDAGTLVQNLTTAADPEAAYLALSPAERSAVDDYLQVATIEVESSTTTLNHHDVLMQSEWTKTNKYQVVGKTFYGLKVWTFKSQTKWYYDGAIITRAPRVSPSGETHYLFWRYLGIVSQSQEGGYSYTYHYDDAQGEFAYCPPVTGCVNYDYPAIHKSQFGDGTYSAWGN